jgi:hypothetical protein
MTAIPPDFASMFHPGTRYGWPDGTHSVIDVHAVGELKLPTGRLIAQDPRWGIYREVPPFTVPIPPGRYPVILSISHWDQSPTPGTGSPLRLVNAAKLVVADQPATSWELALQPAQDPAALDEEQFFGFGVDSGTGCFIDAAAREHLHQLQQDQQWRQATSAIGTQGGIDIATTNPDFNIIMFKCGMGDGSYPVWIGRSASHDPVCLIAELELLRHSLGPAASQDTAL